MSQTVKLPKKRFVVQPKHDPDDGIKYINIYSQGKTDLGKFLSNFHSEDVKTDEGEFYSIEGYWYYLLTDSNDREELKKTSGWKAKELGLKLKNKSLEDTDEFKDKIKKAIKTKITDRYGKMRGAHYTDEFIKSTLPFKHHYVYDSKIVPVRGCDWIVEYIEELRIEAKTWKKCNFQANAGLILFSGPECGSYSDKDKCPLHENLKCHECNHEAVFENSGTFYCSEVCKSIIDTKLMQKKIDSKSPNIIIYDKTTGRSIEMVAFLKTKDIIEKRKHEAKFSQKMDSLLK